MTNFEILVIVTYLYAIFLMVLRIKLENKLTRLFKLFLFILTLFCLFYLINYDGNGNLTLTVRIIIFLPLLYLDSTSYSNELNNLFKKTGLVKTLQKQPKINNELSEVLMDSVEYLSRRKIGALITIERNINLSPFINKALMLNANASKELLTSIFIPSTPLHDGAVIIRGSKILCAKAYYPSTERTDLPRTYGTRHRAAIGISEQSDALTIVVSEETGNVSITINRQIEYNISRETLNLYFEKFLKIN